MGDTDILPPMTPLKVVVLDDEPLARGRLARLLREAGCEVAGEFAHGTAFLQWLEHHPTPDAIFLDIQMPGASGFEVLAELAKPVAVVFVTAFSEHAVKAFEIDAVDYLVKPVFAERLERTLERVRSQQSVIPAVNPVVTPPKAKEELPTRITVRAGEGRLFLELRHVTHFQVEQEKVWACTGSRKFRTTWTSIKEVEEALPGLGCVRIHRNVLLRPECVLGYKPLIGGRLSLRLPDSVELEVSRSATPMMREFLKQT